MRAAFFDIGTNTIHMLVVEIHRDGTFRVLDHEKDNTRLGDGSFRSRQLGPQTFRRGVEVLDRFCRLAREHGVTRWVAVATSAVRDAQNGEQFAAAVYRKTGLRIRVISGKEESRLIFLGALAGRRLGRRRVLVIDVGGGSVELIVGRPAQMDFLDSFPLGVSRLTDLFLQKDPPSKKQLEKLECHVEKVLRKSARKIRKLSWSQVVGASGTMINLGSMIYESKTMQPFYLNKPYSFSRKALRRVHQKIVSISLRERLRFPGLDAKRADLIVAGSALTLALMRLLKFKKITLSRGGIREGLVLDFIEKNRHRLPRLGARI